MTKSLIKCTRQGHDGKKRKKAFCTIVAHFGVHIHEKNIYQIYIKKLPKTRTVILEVGKKSYSGDPKYFFGALAMSV